MELHKYLPSCLIDIVEEYAKDRTQYNKVMDELDFFNKHITCVNFSLKRTLNYFHRKLADPYASIYGGSLSVISKCKCQEGCGCCNPRNCSCILYHQNRKKETKTGFYNSTKLQKQNYIKQLMKRP